MTRTIMALAAVSSLTLSSVALAQTPTPNPPAPNAPAVTGTVTQQQPDQWLASDFRGTNVIGADDAKIGDVSDVLFDKGGTVQAVIVGVGGFLGIGSKDVALPLNAFQVIPGADGKADRLRLSMTKDQLASAQEFKPASAQKAASALGTSPPAPGPAMPAAPAPRAPANNNQ